MATNDFLLFAGGAGANVLSQADYEALAALGPGFGSGILLSEQLNKVLRQGSVMASALGKWIADTSGDNVVDDGTTTAIVASLGKAMTALLGAGGTGASDYISIPFRDKTTGVRRVAIIQWGVVSTSGVADTSVTFPIAFPTALWSLVASEYSGGVTSAANSPILGLGSQTTTGFVVGTYNTSGARSSDGIKFIAIGY